LGETLCGFESRRPHQNLAKRSQSKAVSEKHIWQQSAKLEAEEDWGNTDCTLGTNRVRALLMILVGAFLLGGCAAKQKTESNQPVTEPATGGAGQPVSPDNLHLARDEYDRAVANYQNCVLENTANLSACEKQRAAMNTAATILFGPSNKKNTIVNEGR
jgi:hypothetical protein